MDRAPVRRLSDDEQAQEFADLYDLAPSPTIVRLLRPGPDERRHEIARNLLIGARLAAGESVEALIDDGLVTDADLADLDDESQATT